jgi:putative acetyltransferase
MDLCFEVDDPRAADARGLIAAHLGMAHEVTPPEHVHALDLDGLVDPAVTFFSVRAGTDRRLLGMGAVKRLADDHAELKSMHVAADARGLGVGAALLDHLLDQARARGCQRVSLETGTGEAFAPAQRLYRRAGFEPFADYTKNPYSICMTRLL